MAMAYERSLIGLYNIHWTGPGTHFKLILRMVAIGYDMPESPTDSPPLSLFSLDPPLKGGNPAFGGGFPVQRAFGPLSPSLKRAFGPLSPSQNRPSAAFPPPAGGFPLRGNRASPGLLPSEPLP